MRQNKKTRLMRKALSIVIVIAIILGFSGTAFATITGGNLIGLDKAKEIALSDAGKNIADVHYCSGYLEYINKTPSYYQVEFVVGAVRYYYQISAYAGIVLNSQTQTLRYNYPPKTSVSVKTDKNNKAVIGDIGQEAAKQAALNQAGVTDNQIEKLKIKRELKSSGLQYKVEFKIDKMKYKYTIDGITGQIVK